jgi:hypothetical protein
MMAVEEEAEGEDGRSRVDHFHSPCLVRWPVALVVSKPGTFFPSSQLHAPDWK